MVPSKCVMCDPSIQLTYRVIHDADHIKNESWLKELNFSKGVLQKLTQLGMEVARKSRPFDAYCDICSALLQS